MLEPNPATPEKNKQTKKHTKFVKHWNELGQEHQQTQTDCLYLITQLYLLRFVENLLYNMLGKKSTTNWKPTTRDFYPPDLESVAYLRGKGTVRCPPFGRPWKFFAGDYVSKSVFFAIFQQKLQNSTMFDGLLSYRYNMRLKSPCKIASDMTRQRRRALLKTSCKPYRRIIRGGWV